MSKVSNSLVGDGRHESELVATGTLASKGI